MSDGFDIALRWATGLTEPLLSTAARVAADDAMRERAGRHPRWAAVLFAGALADVLTTLPPDDPWRRLSARIGELRVGSPPRDDLGTGAWRRGAPGGPRRFGTWRDAADLTGPPTGPATSAPTRGSPHWPNRCGHRRRRCSRSPPPAARRQPPPSARWARTGRRCSPPAPRRCAGRCTGGAATAALPTCGPSRRSPSGPPEPDTGAGRPARPWPRGHPVRDLPRAHRRLSDGRAGEGFSPRRPPGRGLRVPLTPG